MIISLVAFHREQDCPPGTNEPIARFIGICRKSISKDIRNGRTVTIEEYRHARRRIVFPVDKEALVRFVVTIKRRSQVYQPS